MNEFQDYESVEGLVPAFQIIPEDQPLRKQYLLLLYIDPTADSRVQEQEQTFQFIEGRQEAYDLIKRFLDKDNVHLDVMKSRILVSMDPENKQMSNRASIYKFMKEMKEKKRVYDDTNFNIDEYYYDIDELEIEYEEET